MSLAHAFEDLKPQRESDALADLISRMGVRMAYAKDEEIYAQEDPVEFLYLVVQGAVRTTHLMSDGRRQVAEFYYPGEVFGLEPGPDHRFSAEAVADAIVVVVKRSAVAAFADDGALERAIWRATRRELDRTQTHLMLLGRKTACERVASFLQTLIDRAPAQEGCELAMSRQDMADYLGLTIETVSRMLTQLQAERVVEFKSSRRFQVRDPEALSRLAE